MQDGGRPSNHLVPIETLIDRLHEPKARVIRQGALAKLSALHSMPAAEPFIVRPKQGRIQEAVVAVLEEAGGPLSVSAVMAAVGSRLDVAVSRGSVEHVLTVAVRRGRFCIERVGPGRYVISKGS